MRLFKRRKVASHPKTDVLASRVAGAILSGQARIANNLNRRTQHWNKASKLIALTLFLLVFGSICLYLIIKSI